MGREGNIRPHAWIMGLVLTGVALAGCMTQMGDDDGSSGDGEESGTYSLGALLPISGQGAPYGEPALRAVQMAVDEINAQGGINGRTVEVVVGDSRFPETQEALAGFESLAGQGIQIVISPTDSDSNAAIKPRAAELEVVQISPFATNPDLSEPNGYFFRTIADDSVQGPQAARYVYEDLGQDRIVVMYEETDYGTGLHNAFVAAYEDLGGEIVGDSIQWPHDDSEFPGKAQEAVGHGEDFIWIAGQSPHIANLIDEIRDQGHDGQIMGTEAVESDDIFDLAGDSVNGLIFTKSAPPAGHDAAEAFEADYRDRFGESPFVTSPFAYDAAYVAFAAFEAVGADGPAIRDWLVDEAAVPDRVTTDTIQFDASGDVTTGGYQLWVADADAREFRPYAG